ncbi:MAG: hemolysin family protein [Desulfovibrionales bacterium]
MTILRRIFSPKSENHVQEMILEARAEGELKGDEAAMLLNVLRLRQKQVQEIMVPRPDIAAVEAGSSIQDVAELIIEKGHSRIPIYKGNKDHIIGIVHAKDLLKSLLDPAEKDRTLESIMRQPLFIPETKNLENMILEFQSKKVHLAIAVDEYGGTSGLVTFEDVLEEIVGEIEDEYDIQRPDEIQPLEENTYLVAGRALLEDLEEDFNISLKSEQVETVGGFITEKIGRVPQPQEIFDFDGFRFTIRDADAKQIHWMVVEPLELQYPSEE